MASYYTGSYTSGVPTPSGPMMNFYLGGPYATFASTTSNNFTNSNGLLTYAGTTHNFSITVDATIFQPNFNFGISNGDPYIIWQVLRNGLPFVTSSAGVLSETIFFPQTYVDYGNIVCAFQTQLNQNDTLAIRCFSSTMYRNIKVTGDPLPGQVMFATLQITQTD
jgi:hypothetical protein